MLNIFEVFIPQLLLYPNANDPLNGHAASIYLKDPKEFTHIVKSYVKKFASPEILESHDMCMEEEEDLSELESFDEFEELLFD